jgi:hypothetical protein
MTHVPDDQQRVWIVIEHEEGRVQAVFDLPTKTFQRDHGDALHANEVVDWFPIEDE